MKILTTTLFILLFLFSLQAQKEDYNWLIGYAFEFEYQGKNKIDFNYDPPQISTEWHPVHFYNANSSISSPTGELLFYTNGVRIGHAEWEIMENGDSLGTADKHLNYVDNNFGFPINQGVLTLRKPGSENEYYVIYNHLDAEEDSPTSPESYELLYALIDMNQDGGLGNVIEKNISFTEEKPDFGGLTAVRHANGRDWWIPVQGDTTNVYAMYLLDPTGLHLTGSQTIGVASNQDGLLHTVYSPDGSKYAKYDLYSFSEPTQISYMGFNRCTGMFTEQQVTYEYTNTATSSSFGGVAFSPDSRYLYLSTYLSVIQFDTEDPDMFAHPDTVAVYDGFQDTLSLGFPTFFLYPQLAPNGKIYISTEGNTLYLHTIHNPNAAGVACDVQQHDFDLPKRNDRGIPNLPNFRLKALAGSPCDTLRPIAAFDYDSTGVYQFTDASERTPTEWFWTFGDGSFSDLQNPIYSYAESGTYEVCLTVSNEAGSDTVCQMLTYLTTSTDELVAAARFSVFPNPTISGSVQVVLPEVGAYTYRLTDSYGRLVREGIFEERVSRMQVSGDMPSGVYFLHVEGLGVRFVVWL